MDRRTDFYINIARQYAETEPWPITVKKSERMFSHLTQLWQSNNIFSNKPSNWTGTFLVISCKCCCDRRRVSTKPRDPRHHASTSTAPTGHLRRLSVSEYLDSNARRQCKSPSHVLDSRRSICFRYIFYRLLRLVKQVAPLSQRGRAMPRICQ